MKRLALLLGVAALTVPALAQDVKPLGMSVKGGLFFPSKKSARDQGANWFTLGIDYKLKDLKFGDGPDGMNTSLVLSADYVSKGDFRHTPVMANYVVRRNEVYYFAGAGFGFVKTPSEGNQTRFAYQIGVGKDFQRGGNPLFVEGRWIGNAKDEVSGFAISVGIRL
ncbi:MAG: hypothetical protein AMXMBFR81_12200 [Chthonomonas sp.]|nr:hypothetical protein [Fimbriimonadaceae bacterium]MBZ0214333.1 hypothetical protein [Fimbriimonadaceae bacterium]